MKQTAPLDLADIQGNILRSYAFHYACYIQLRLTRGQAARRFVAAILPSVTNAEVWPHEKPESTLNIALGRSALSALEIPQPTINSFPNEFLQGMAARAASLGDTGDSAPEQWEEAWQHPVDVLISIHARTDSARLRACEAVDAICKQTGGATITGLQDAGKLRIDHKITAKEHFGYTDGISQPEFEHSHSRHTPGDGKLNRKGQWLDLATGDFLIGYPNEAKELEACPLPTVFSRNGTFMVYRKLRQDVKSFRQYIAEWGARYPGGPEKLQAKFMGRWPDGTPLSLSPDRPDPELAADAQRNNDFTYKADPQGLRCPLGAHVRRGNPRDSLGFHGKLAERRRIIRRGMPYGAYAPDQQDVDDSDRGLIFICLNANLSRQFEFVQQQWINYGNDFHLGEESDPVIGNRAGSSRYIIPGDPGKGEESFVCAGLPSFVTLKGGDYFFIPSITALQMISEGMVDPR